jgi:Tfp pilus assembly protein FimT
MLGFDILHIREKGKQSLRKIAFTLAEVLIVLGIVGLIAEITIPNLVDSINETQLYVGARKAYSTLSQAVVMLEADPNRSMDSTDKNTIRDSFLYVFKKVAQGVDSEVFGTTVYRQYKSTSSFTVNYSQAAAAFLDSAYMAVWFANSCSSNSSTTYLKCAELTYDTNGIKPPNMMGYDLLSFWLLKKMDAYAVRPKGSPDLNDGYSCVPGATNETTADGCSYYRVMGLTMP